MNANKKYLDIYWQMEIERGKRGWPEGLTWSNAKQLRVDPGHKISPRLSSGLLRRVEQLRVQIILARYRYGLLSSLRSLRRAFKFW